MIQGKENPSQEKTQPGKGKPRKSKEYIFLSLVPPVGQHHMSVLGEFKTDDGQTQVHATVWRRTYMRPLSVGLMDAWIVKPSSVGMMATLAATVTSTIFLVPNSLLSFNLKENSLMKKLQPSQRLNGISTSNWFDYK